MPSIFAAYELTNLVLESPGGSLHVARHRETNVLALVQRPNAQWTIEHGRQKLLREAGVLAQLSAVPGVGRVLELLQTATGDALVLNYFAGTPLVQTGKAPDLGTLLVWGQRMVEIVDAVHRAGFLHRNLNPSSFLVSNEGQLLLLDFSLASPITEERRANGTPDPVRDWSCLAPEQTGRMHAAADRRTDYYALGMVLYRLVTGEPAFAVSSPLEAVHAHLAKVPVPPRGCPEGLANLILKLLAKAPEQRYQSATGLLADLVRCHDLWKADQRIGAFPLGTDDLADRLRPPRQLLGREREIEALRTAYDATLQGSREALVLSGPSGVGKSALAAEAGRWVIADQGFFLAGKYDDAEREQPYSAVIQMIEDLTRQIGQRSDRALWQQTFAEILGDSQAVVTALAPAFEEVTGTLPAPPVLPPRETENRFLYTMEAFFRALRAPGRSLVVFFDDLQWIDAASARLLEYLWTQKDPGQVLALFAYRTNEPRVSEAFPELLKRLTAIATQPPLLLEALPVQAVEDLLGEALGAPVRDPRGLAQALWNKTGGSPFFLVQLMRRLHGRGLLHYDRQARQWNWDEAQLSALPASENVSDLLIEQFRNLPPTALALLGIGSCLGTTIHSTDLEAFRDALPDLAEALWPLIDQQYLVPQSDGYLALGTAAYRAGTGAPLFSLRFQHDRIRQAAYGQLDPSTRALIHLKAGRALEDARPIEAAGHYLAVLDRIEPALRDQLARLLIRAGDAARASSATRQALGFFRQAQALADEGRLLEGERRRLRLLLAETAFVCHETEEATTVSASLLEQLGTPVERAEVLMMEMDAFTFLGRMDEALDRGRRALAVLGVGLSVRPPLAVVAFHLIRVLTSVSRRSPDRLFERREAVPDRSRLLIRLLGKFLVPAQMSGNAGLFAVSTLMATEEALRHGNSEETSAAFGNFAILLSVLGRHRQAFEFASLAMRLEQARPNPKNAAMVHSAYSFFTLAWNRPWNEVPPAALRGAEAARRAGDLFFMAYQPLFASVFATPATLGEAIVSLEETLRTIAPTRQDDALVGGTFALQRWRALAGERPHPADFSDPGFDENEAVRAWEAKKNASGLAVYRLYKLQVLAHLHRFDEAWDQWCLAQPHAPSILGSAYMEEYAVYTVLIAAERARRPGDRGRALKALAAQRRRLAQWAATCPENFAGLLTFAQAEEANARGQRSKAAQGWARALEAAQGTLHVRWKALVHERAGRFHLDQGEAALGRYLLADASRLYAVWGAKAVVTRLEHEFPSQATGAPSVDSTQGLNGDAASLWKVSQVISREMDVDRLLTVVVQAVIENAGARRGWLLLRGEEGWEAVVRGDAEGTALTFAQRVSPTTEGIPEVVLAEAANEGGLLIASAFRDPRFSGDPLVRARQVKSVLALPFSPPGSSLEALWYLENDLVEGAFSADRLEGLRLLSSQVGISLENARMYRALTNLNRDLEGRVRDRTAELEETNRQFLHSVEYAGVLQRSLLPKEWGPTVADRFALWLPKDIVGGDLYWYRESSDSCLLALVDCTGHGVPGSLITVLVHSLLEDAWRTSAPGDLAAIVASTHRQFRRVLGQHRADSESNDGFDLGLLWWSPQGGELRYAGARISLLQTLGGTATWIHGGRRGLGYHETPDDVEALVHILPRRPGARYYLTSDGLLGQVGGDKAISFGRERFADLLSRTAGLPMEDQGQALKDSFDLYKGSRSQADDITVLGVQLR